ncbi:zf-HC2 domain-containing protein [uncultured Thermus sp.]|uniref:anti-sigma factor n=1 Tax=uncultured Thermus sp. TaxID=157149 RepID=UPI002612F4D0|nr:zf-HC2 domain-containing protein [uncultured Thermus sp.]
MEELLTDYVTGGLKAEEQAQVETHLRTCPRCQGELGSLEQAFYALAKTLTPVPPPPEGLSKIQARLRWDRRKRMAIRAFLLAAIMAGFFILLGTYLGQITQVQEATLEKVAYWVSDPETQWRLVSVEGNNLGLLLWREDGLCLVLLRELPPRSLAYQLWGEEGGLLYPLTGGRTHFLEADYGRFRTLVLSLEPEPENMASGKPRPSPPTHFLARLTLP